MMIHEKLMSGQFLLDFKNERTNLLHGAVTHQRTHSATRHQQDIYSAYACQQRQLIGSSSSDVDQHRQPLFGVAAEVLDLSRRYESVETSRKTPSPYQTSSSLGTNSPNLSPTSSEQHQRQQFIPTNLLYAAQPVRQLPPPLASLYPALYYAGNVKQEPVTTSTSSPPPPMALCPASPQQLSPVPSQFTAVAASNNLLQSFGPTASIVSGATLPDIAFAPLSPAGSKSPIVPPSVVTTPTSSISVATALTNAETKSTRPFKAFPRDPLVIAANFAAADVLLDNPRVERYTEYRKRVLEQIRSSNGGTRTVTNPKMRRTNSINVSVSNGASSTHNSENEERHEGAEDLSDCDSNMGNCEKMSTSITSTSSSASINATKSRCSDNNANTTTTASASSITNTTSGGQIRDAAYYERRRKNNAAAKKSRDRRRIKEDEIAIRAAYLERQNIELLCQIDALKAQLATFTSKIGA